MTTPRIIGIILSRNEWPLVGAVADHALRHHVDELWAFDHASSDRSIEGLSALASKWPDRLHVRQLPNLAFHQAAMQAVALAEAGVREGDWIYFIDADEFALSARGGLRDVLAQLAPSVDVVRYEMTNWVAPTANQHFAVTALDGTVHRAAPVVFVELPGLVATEQLELGVNFFDLPLASKVIYRHRNLRLPLAGTHGVLDPEGTVSWKLDKDTFEVAHVPLVCRDRLTTRAAQGQRLIDDGYPIGHGWQLQYLAREQMLGDLDAFWARHSVGSHLDPSLHLVHDEALVNATSATRELFHDPQLLKPKDADAEAETIGIVPIFDALVRTNHNVELTMHRYLALRGDTHEADELHELVRSLTSALDGVQHELKAVYDSRTWRWGRRLARWAGRS